MLIQSITSNRASVNKYSQNIKNTEKPSNTNFKALIHNCAYNGDLQGLKRELAKGIDINLKNKYCDTPLIYAVSAEREHIVDELINSKNIKLDIQNIFGMTALHKAVINQNENIVEKLLLKILEMNPDNLTDIINIKDTYKKTPRAYANKNIEDIFKKYMD